jgi:hypothetical protein
LGLGTESRKRSILVIIFFRDWKYFVRRFARLGRGLGQQQ